MNIMTDADFRKSVKNGLSGIYFFYGEEDYLKLHALTEARSTVCPDPSLEFFNDVRIDCSDFDSSALANALPNMPVMEEKKLIEMTGLNLSSLKKAEQDIFFSTLAEAADYDFNVIIIVATADGFDEGKPPKKPSALCKRLSDLATLVKFPRSTPAMLSRWAQRHFAHNGIEADLSVCSVFVDFCGKDMFLLSSETDKLSCYLLANGRAQLTREDIPEVCIPDTGYDTFALVNAISERRRADALGIIAEMQRRRIDPIVVMGEISGTFYDMLRVRLLSDDGMSLRDIAAQLKMHEYKTQRYVAAGVSAERLRELLELCSEADLAVKGSGRGYLPIERLICSI